MIGEKGVYVGTWIATTRNVLFVYRSALTVLCCSAISQAAGIPKYLNSLNFDHPHCEQRVELGISREIYREIANKLPGVDEYNELVRLLHKKDWGTFDLKREVFERVYESSPLMEAVYFLKFQASIEQLDGNNDSETRKSEKAIREAAFLYPKSELLPAASASLGDLWLRLQKPDRAIGLFQALQKNYPESPYQCLFKAGIGESFYQLNEWETAIKTMEEIHKDCGRNLKVLALVRIADSAIKLKKYELAESTYKELMDQYFFVVDREYKSALYNAGEMKYKLDQLESAKHYFKQYTKVELQNASCVPYAKKRQADIALLQQKPRKIVIGKYLIARESNPKADVSRYSYVRALLLEFTESSRPERERKLKVVNMELGDIVDSEMKYLGLVEKGIALLRSGELGAIPFLGEVDRSYNHRLRESSLIGITQKAMVDAMTKFTRENPNPEVVLKVLQEVAKGKELWESDSNMQAKVANLYTGVVSSVFARRLSGERSVDGSFGLLSELIMSSFWTQGKINDSSTQALVEVLIGALTSNDIADARKDEIAIQTIKQEEILRKIIDEKAVYPLLAAKYHLKDKKGVADAVDVIHAHPVKFSGDTKDAVSLLLGMSMNMKGDYKGSVRELSSIEGKKFAAEKVTELLNVYTGAQKYQQAFDLMHGEWKHWDSTKRTEMLPKMLSVVEGGKIWTKASVARQLAEKIPGIDKAWVSKAMFLEGRAEFERNRCKSAIPKYREAIAVSPDSPEIAEARYRMGKCFVKQKKFIEAEKEWRLLEQMKDGFWSPLATNEIKLIKP